ncbi:MAG: hypothetical protein HYY17_05025 [Planctomycetes bacterium]|nr:hypothetical protein [Planctomycetota bacterium]
MYRVIRREAYEYVFCRWDDDAPGGAAEMEFLSRDAALAFLRPFVSDASAVAAFRSLLASFDAALPDPHGPADALLRALVGPMHSGSLRVFRRILPGRGGARAAETRRPEAPRGRRAPIRLTVRFQVLNLRPAPGALDLYVVRDMGGGIESSFGNSSPGKGAIVRDIPDRAARANVTAHEIGHVLGLSEYGGGPSSTAIRRELWALRNLMHDAAFFGGLPEETENGYGEMEPGRRRAGSLLGIRTVPRLHQCRQVEIVRRAVEERRYEP